MIASFVVCSFCMVSGIIHSFFSLHDRNSRALIRRCLEREHRQRRYECRASFYSSCFIYKLILQTIHLYFLFLDRFHGFL